MTKRKPPRRAPPPKRSTTADPLPGSNTNALTIENAKADTPPVAPARSTAWREMSWSQPPLGQVVMFFYQGRIVTGMEIMDPMGIRQRALFENAERAPLPPGIVKVFMQDFTHWRLLPSERP